MNARSPLDWRVLVLVIVASLATGLALAASPMAPMGGGMMVMPPVWMAACVIFMGLVIVLLIVAISILVRIGSSSTR